MVPPYVCTGDNGTLYEQFHVDVQGSGQLRENAAIFDKLATEYNQHKFALKDALNGIQVTYTGQGAEMMRGAFEPLIESVGQGFDLCRRSSVLLTDQGGGFDTAQSKIHKPVDVPEKPWLYSITPWDTEHDVAIQRNSQIDSANQQAFSQYAKTSLSNSNGAPRFDSASAGFGEITVRDSQPSNPGNPEHGGGRFGGGTGRSGGRQPGDRPDPVEPVRPPTRGGDGGVQPGGVLGGERPGGGIAPGARPGEGTDLQDYVPPPNSSQGLGASGGPTASRDGFGSTGGFAQFGNYAGGAGGASGGPGGAGSGYGRGVGGAGGAGTGAAPRGPGAVAGIGLETGSRSPAAMTRSGTLGTAMPAGGLGGGAARQEEDDEHATPTYLVNEDNGDQIIGDLPRTPPSVID